MTQNETTLVEINPETGKACRLIKPLVLPSKTTAEKQFAAMELVVPTLGRNLSKSALQGKLTSITPETLIDIMGIQFLLASIIAVSECLDVVSNGVGTSVVIFLSDKTVKIFASAETIDAFFKAYQ